MRIFFKKMLISIFLVFFVFQQFFVFNVEIARAQLATVDVSASVRAAMDSVWEGMKAAAIISLIKLESMMVQKIAADTATYIAHGGEGKSALAFENGFKSYLSNLALDAAASSLDEFFRSSFGVSICKPNNIKFSLNLAINLGNLFDDPNNIKRRDKINCSWKEMMNNLDKMKGGFGDYFEDGFESFTVDPTGRVLKAIDPKQSDLGIALELSSRIGRNVSDSVLGGSFGRLEGLGLKPLTDAISGKIISPAESTRSQLVELQKKQDGGLSSKQMGDLIASGSASALVSGGAVFLNTLATEWLKRKDVQKQGLLPVEDDYIVDDIYGGNNVGTGFNLVNNKRKSLVYNFSLATAKTSSVNNYDVILDFATCPESNDFLPKLNNCVIDEGFKAALDEAVMNKQALTVAEAIEKGYLKANWPLIPPTHEYHSQYDCYKKGYCYSNLQKLRKVGVLPLGFEIAALSSSPDEPWTLGEVVAGFYDCNENGQLDSNHPFCHLIDPNWLLKKPLAKCEVKGYGSGLVSSDLSVRQEECTDVSVCIHETEDGNCLDEYYGYCLQTRNTWQIPGRSCPSVFNTCQTYTNVNTGKTYNLLSRTVDSKICNENSDGCRAYALNKDLNTNNWLIDNSVIFLNNKIDNVYGCNAENEGCHAFLTMDNKEIYAKKAPDYLHCYDTNIDTSRIDWPITKADLDLLEQRSDECKKYASACLPEELNCSHYTPINNNSLDVNAVLSETDGCPTECVGYETYKQLATDFEPEKFPLYFIPQNAQKCSVVGCEEFTVLNEQGGEKIAYYSQLKYCQSKDKSQAKIYYIWSESGQDKYSLKKYSFKPVDEKYFDYIDNIDFVSVARNLNTEVIPQKIKEYYRIGSPVYAQDSAEKLLINYELCNEQTYNILLVNPNDPKAAPLNCQKLYDENGEIYYRLVDRTVLVSDNCQILRKTDSYFEINEFINNREVCLNNYGQWRDGACYVCTNGGEYDIKTDSCLYYAIPEESLSCPASDVGCRFYKGNNGNNIKQILFFNFENDSDLELWSAVNGQKNLSPVSLQKDGKSLEVESSALIYEFAKNKIKNKTWYKLSFWLKSPTGASISVSFLDKDGHVVGSWPTTVVGNNDWQSIEIGPIIIESSAENKKYKLKISSSLETTYYLDNFRLIELTDQLALIKDSWKINENGQLVDVPLSCDRQPNDNKPGLFLGCQAYKDDFGNIVNIRKFANLCRPEAIGCSKVIDTQNTLDTDKYVVLNAKCLHGDVDKGICQHEIDGRVYGCELVDNQETCYVDKITVENLDLLNDKFDYRNPFNTKIYKPDSEPIYLAINNTKLCPQTAVGCTKLAEIDRDLANNKINFKEKIIKIDPQTLIENSLMCLSEQEGCTKFITKNEEIYFKDPQILGNKFCEYKEISDDKIGWFLVDDYGRCSNNQEKICQESQDCYDENAQIKQGICEKPAPCYTDYQINGEYQIYSSGSRGYKNFVGQCPIEYSGCTELVDRMIRDNSYYDSSGKQQKGKPYYVIFDDDIEQALGECNGKVSLKQGCILFDKTNQPEKIYNTQATYSASVGAEIPYDYVEPVSDDNNDANLILKVKRDRECSKWLDCISYVVEKDNSGQRRLICTDFATCKKEEKGHCVEWSATDEDKFSLLNLNRYINRDISWFGEEYTGLSIYKHYNVNYLREISFPGEDVYYLAFIPPNTSSECLDSEGRKMGVVNETDFKKCFHNQGRCYNGRCIMPTNGPFADNVPSDSKSETLSIIKKYLNKAQCKIYPEKDSPYSVSVVVNKSNVKKIISNFDPNVIRFEYQQRRNLFANANVCNGNDCSCEYRKVSYKDSQTTDYWPINYNSSNIPEGVCVSGEKAGYPCRFNSDCGINNNSNNSSLNINNTNTGICEKIKKINDYYGQRSFCLEYDYSRPLIDVVNGKPIYPCLTWMPFNRISSVLDENNLNVQSGYWPKLDSEEGYGQFYCANASAITVGDDECKDGNCVELYNQLQTDIENSLVDLTADKKMYVKSTEPFFWLLSLSRENSNVRDMIESSGAKLKDIFYKYTAEWLNRNFKILKHNRNQRAVYLKINEDEKKNLKIAKIFNISYWWNNIRWFGLDSVFERSLVESDNLDIRLNNNSVDYLVTQNGNSKVFDEYSWPVYEQEVRRILFTPFYLAGGTSLSPFDSDQGDDNTLGTHLITQNVYIDLEELRTGKVDEDETPIKSFEFVDDEGNDRFKVNYTVPKYANIGTYFGKYPIFTFLAEKQPEYGLNYFDTEIIRYYGIIINTDNYYAKLQQSDEEVKNYSYLQKCIKKMVTKWDNENDWSAYKRSGSCDFAGSFWLVKVQQNGLMRLDSFSASFNSGVAGVVENLNERLGWRTREHWWKEGDFEFNTDEDYNNSTFNYQFKISPAFSMVIQFYPRCVNAVKVHDSNYLLPEFKTYNIAKTNKLYKQKSINIDNIVSINKDTKHEPYSSLPFISESELNKFDNFYPLKDTKSFAYNAYLDESFLEKDRFIGKIDRLFLGFKKYRRFGVHGDKFGEDGNEFLFNDKKYQTSYPRIYSIDPGICLKPNSQTHCRAWDFGFTVNDRNMDPNADYNQDGIKDEDLNSNHHPEPIVAKGYYLAKLRFFASANDDHLPIRRVLVKWGDETDISYNHYGYYQNHKPYCQITQDNDNLTVGRCVNEQNNIITTITCLTDYDCQELGRDKGEYKCIKDDRTLNNFGDTDRACLEEYFEFSHQYRCDTTVPDSDKKTINDFHGLEKEDLIFKLKQIGYKTEEDINQLKFCVYKPAVQVMDNWLWCNGRCDKFDGNGMVKGCNNMFELDVFNKTEQCDKIDNKNYPWLDYSGDIILINLE